jgi:twinkle protein
MGWVLNHLNFDLKNRSTGIIKISCPLSGCVGRKNRTDKPLSVNLDKRVFKCHHCGESGSLDKFVSDKEYKEPVVKWHDLSPEAMEVLNNRGISERVIIRNKIKLVNRYSHVTKENKDFIAFPYFDGVKVSPVNYKYRAVDGKEFGQEANARPLMYAINEWKSAEEVIIVEGEIDVLSFNEAEVWNVTSINAGAINENDKNIDGKLQCLYESHKYFSNKKRIILFCDQDAPGKRLQRELANKVGTYRCWVITPPEGYKDANEVLIGSKEKSLPPLGKQALKDLIDRATPMPISGVHFAEDYRESMNDRFENGSQMGDTTHFPDIDRLFRWKPGNVNLCTGYANQGKSYTFLQIMITKSLYDGWKWAVFGPENFPPEDFYDDLIEMIVGKHVQGAFKMSKQEYNDAITFINEHIFFVYPEEAQTIEAMHDRFRSLLISKGINGVLIDPWNQLDSTQGSCERDDQYLSIKLKSAKQFALETGVVYNIIAHPKVKNAPSGMEYPIVTEYDINGGAMWANKVDDIISIYAPHWKEDRLNTTREFHKLKTKRRRTGGSNGSCSLILDTQTCRYQEADSTKIPCSFVRAAQYKQNKEWEQKRAGTAISNGYGYKEPEMFEEPEADEYDYSGEEPITVEEPF